MADKKVYTKAMYCSKCRRSQKQDCTFYQDTMTRTCPVCETATKQAAPALKDQDAEWIKKVLH